MRPRKPDGTAWGAEDSNAVLQNMGQRITREINAMDIARGCPDDGYGNAKTCEYDPATQTYVVNPEWSRIKSPGDLWADRVQAEWREFCSEPRDPAIELGKLGLTAAPLEGPSSPMAAFGPVLAETIQQAIAAGIKAGLSAHNGPHGDVPRRGRPRKQEPQEEITNV